MSLVRKIYIDSRTCSGNPADFTATLPEPIRADPTLGVILSQLTFVNNFETVMRDYTNRLYFGIDLGDTNGLVQTNINDRVYMRVIDDAEAGPNDRIFVIPPATYTLETFKAALQTAFRADYPDWTVGDTITTPGSRVIIPTLGEITNPAWYSAQWRGEEYNPQDSRSLNGFFSGTSTDGVWTGTTPPAKRGVLDIVYVPLLSEQYDCPALDAEHQGPLRKGQ